MSERAGGGSSRGVALAIALAMTSVTATASAAYGDPPRADEDRLHLSAGLYWSQVARHFGNYGLHGQATAVPFNWLELQGAGMLNLPGSNIALFRAEASVYLAYPSLADSFRATGSGGGYVYGYVSYGQTRRRSGLEIGGIVDRHASVRAYYTERRGQPNQYNETVLAPVTSLVPFVGFKWVTQSTAEPLERGVLYAQLLWAIHQSIESCVGTGMARGAPVTASRILDRRTPSSHPRRGGGRKGIVMNARMFTGPATCILALATLALPACTAATDADEGGVQETPEAVGENAAAATSAPHWGSFAKGSCRASDHKRKWSAILWDIPWGQSWEATCAKTKGAPNDIPPRVPDRCVTLLNEWGEWFLDDPTCQPATGSFVSFSTSPQQPCADGRARFSFTARSNKSACFQVRIDGMAQNYGKLECGSGEWTGSVTVDLQSVFGTNVPDSFMVKGSLVEDLAPTVVPDTLATIEREVTTRICN